MSNFVTTSTEFVLQLSKSDHPTMSIANKLNDADTLKNIDSIIGYIDTFCFNTFYHSGRFSDYDQTVGMFLDVDKPNKNIYQKKIWCAYEFTVYPRGIIMFSPENELLANLTNMVFMSSKKMVPLKYIVELHPTLQDNIHSNTNTHTTQSAKIYILKRSNGTIQECIMSDDGCIIFNNRSRCWTIKLLFNDSVINEENRLSLGNKNTSLVKVIKLDDFCSLNEINTLTINWTQMITDVQTNKLEDKISDNQAINNLNGDKVNLYYKNNRQYIQNEIMGIVFKNTRLYFDTLKQEYPLQRTVTII